MFFTLTFLAFLTVGIVYRAQADQPDSPPLGIEIALSKPFYVPAAVGNKVTKVVIRVPLSDEKNQEAISAIKLEPKMEGEKVRVDVYGLIGPTAGIITCQGWDGLKSTKIDSYVASLDEDVALDRIANLGVRMGDHPLTFRIVPKRVLSPTPGNEECECGSCGGLICCPNPGYCIGCGSCGSVCCSNTLQLKEQ